jgi:hypothetical protein
VASEGCSKLILRHAGDEPWAAMLNFPAQAGRGRCLTTESIGQSTRLSKFFECRKICWCVLSEIRPSVGGAIEGGAKSRSKAVDSRGFSRILDLAAGCKPSAASWFWERRVNFMVKLLRAHGGCLGRRRRRRTWQAAISPGEPQAGCDPGISEWGNPRRQNRRTPR